MATQSKSVKVIAQKLVDQLDTAHAKPSDWLGLIDDIAVELEKQRKVELLPEIIRQVKVLSHQAGQSKIVYVTSAVELTEKQKVAIQKKVEQQFGEGVVIQAEVDRSLLGGVIIRYKDKEIDISVKKQIQVIHNSIR